MKKRYMNLQGMIFTEQRAKDYYGARFKSAILAKVIVDSEMNVTGSWK